MKLDTPLVRPAKLDNVAWNTHPDIMDYIETLERRVERYTLLLEGIAHFGGKLQARMDAESLQ